MTSIEQRVRALEDRFAIQELVSRYCFAIDARDRSALMDCFTEDIEFRRQDRTWGRGRDELWSLLSEQLRLFGPTWHLTTNNFVIELDGDEAMSQHYGYAEHAIDNRLVVAAMTYHNGYRRTGGGWRISRRAIDFWYFCDRADLDEQYESRSELWWRGTPPPQLPFSFETYRAFHGQE